MLSLIIPVYRNEENLPRLFDELERLDARMAGSLEVVFVVDGSPDRSAAILRDKLAGWSLRTRLIELSRNFGSFAAIGAGLSQAAGDQFAVIAADLQEPPDLVIAFERILVSGEADVVFGHREGRGDPWFSRVMSELFWTLYRRFVVPDMPKGGIDVFGCTRRVRDHLVQMRELNTNLVALLLWLGFRRTFVPYQRRARLEGRSAWTFGKKFRYALDSVFNFTDLPIRILLGIGTAAVTLAVAAGAAVVVRWWMGLVPVLGYTPLMLAIVAFGGVTALGLGIVGQYQWLSLQNTRNRPPFVVMESAAFDGAAIAAAAQREPDAPRSTRNSS